MNEFEAKVHEHDITLARLETLIEQNDRRFDTVEHKIDSSEKNTTARIDSLEKSTTTRIDSSEKSIAARLEAVERKIDNLDRRMNWFLGLLFTSWLSTIGAILYKLQ